MKKNNMDVLVFTPEPTDTTSEIVKTMVYECIKLAKEGEAPYIYVDMNRDGVRYGVSLSFHYIEGDFRRYEYFASDETQDEEFIENFRLWTELYLSCSDERNSKSFLRKVKSNCISIDEAKLLTLRPL